ncbi:hypothetical protein COCSUDRAFT_57606 [Coccomyxa subellipsoidea C-169]|uniref:Glycosyltransferase family 32 protein n=1 Tax=Coccomyxa subellipsoidea (strain C-169) TaxID=574566 RepID=I0YPY7_COCSC|nr:hypothetical protein COCSUDRAFT_57606 [Coccomyxa subellipsoidea C-169]EIE20456.1 hypothetical protein COCSUDRAFT_57606 [Coccomyxa subellipsoidea C-169]|eukprot:XP_005645000.1 hypothetical protein COCSUDRAFT_57606 [Coccomyxa subellipsoidea C-169]
MCFTGTTEEAKALGTGMKREWRESCMAQHANWTYMFWDKAAALKLLNNRYPWFTKIFLSYRKVVSQGDALRPFLMHSFGGLYVDLDVECYRSSEAFLAGHDLVFQSEKNEEDVSNAMVASITGHPFWNAVVRKMIVEAKRANEKTLHSGSILTSTGPDVFKEVFKRWAEYVRPQPPYGGEYMVHGTRVKYYPRGHWFVPCLWDDTACHKGTNLAAAAGKPDARLAGHHQFTGSWLGTLNETDATPKPVISKGEAKGEGDAKGTRTEAKLKLRVSLT